MKIEAYEPPVIVKHQSGLGNKFGRGETVQTIKEIDGHDIDEIVEKFGSPSFVFSERTIRETHQNAYDSFSRRYPYVQFAWSYKTNYLDAVCNIFHSEGSKAEVVSEYEYEMAVANGINGKDIIYNGPYKPYDALETAVKNGSMIHIDHYDELSDLEDIADKLDCKIDVGIRLNMDTGIYPQWDRFGFNYDNGEALSAARRIAAGGRLNITGIHSHIGTFVLEPSAYEIQVKKMLEFVNVISCELGFDIDYIDIGGGFPSSSTLHGQYSSGEDSNLPVDIYAERITSVLLEHGKSSGKFLKLILETGRALIDQAGYMITKVVANKRLANGTRAVILDSGVNSLFTSFWYKHKIYPVRNVTGIFEETVLYGPLCMNIDIVRPSIKMPALKRGDLLVVAPVGAYNVTQWLQFIRMRPPVLMAHENGEISCIRKSEGIDALKRYENP